MKYINGLLLAGLMILPGIAKADEATPAAAPVKPAVTAPKTDAKPAVATHHKKKTTQASKKTTAPAAAAPVKAAN